MQLIPLELKYKDRRIQLQCAVDELDEPIRNSIRSGSTDHFGQVLRLLDLTDQTGRTFIFGFNRAIAYDLDLNDGW